jgi:hypothetical protein
MVLSFNHLRASLITAVQLIKAGLSTAKQTLIQTGLQLATTVRQTLQRVILSQLQNKGHVVKMKLGLLRLKGSSYAQTLMGRLLTQVGLKSQKTVRQPQQRAQRQNSKGR